jgi:hypothetical protein
MDHRRTDCIRLIYTVKCVSGYAFYENKNKYMKSELKTST